MSPRLLAAVIAVATSGAPQRSHAAPAAADATTQKARDTFREGQKHYNLGEFAEALDRFKEAYRIKPDPVLLYNIGQCQWKMGDLRAAQHSYRAYLRGAGNVANRPEVEARIAELEQRLRDEANAAPPRTEAPPPVVPPVAPAPSIVAATTGPDEAQPEPRPLLRTWWFWTAVGAAVVAGAVTGFLVTRDPTDVPGTALGSKGAFDR